MDKEEKDCCGVVQAYNKDPVETFAKAKRITPMYRGRPSPCTAKSFLDEWRIETSGLIKTLAIDQGLVDAVGCENDLQLAGRPVVKVTIDPELLKATKACRKAVKEILNAQPDMDGASMIKVFGSAVAASEGMVCRRMLLDWDGR